MDEVILTPEQVAQILQVHPFTVLKFIKQGKLKASKLGRVYRIRRKDVDAFLDDQAAQAFEKKEMNESKGIKSKTASKVRKVSSSKDISGDSSLTNESKERALQENQKLSSALKPEKQPPREEGELPQAKETVIVTDRDEKTMSHRHQEDHYVIELKL